VGIKGRVFIEPRPQENKWRLVVQNTGDEVFGITQNILPANDPNRTQHDDYGRYGHGLPVNPHKVSLQSFVKGDMYHNYPITEDCWIRVGIRGHAQKTVKLPGMNDPPLVIDVKDFNWYAGSPDQHTNQVHNFPGQKEYRPDIENGGSIVDEINALIEQASTHGIKCEGKAQLTAVNAPGGGLSHWEVRYKNEGDQAWIGTCSFKRATNKNDGLGLEAMATPGKGCEAMQRIEAFGNYGVEATPGETLRLGVRGYSWKEVPLPASGSVEIDLKDFKLDTSSMADEYFDKDAVIEKRTEKMKRVQFFENGQPLNQSAAPKVWKGAEARSKATFDAPRLRVVAVPDSTETPGGGWRVTLNSALPEFDKAGRVGFVAGLKLEGADPASEAARKLMPRKLSNPGEEKAWFIPDGADLGGVQATTGANLSVATRGLGWFGTVELPPPGKLVDSQKDDSVWGFREDQYNRKLLQPDFVQRYRK
jgi:hypothetical protein